MKYFVDNINGNDDINITECTKETPYKTLRKLIQDVIKTDKDIKIYLGEGEYKLTSNIFRIDDSTVSIFGKNDKTILTQTESWFSNSCGGSSSLTLEFYNLIYRIDKELTSPNLNYIYSNINFYNIVFDEIPNNDYSVFLPYDSTINFYNCTKTNKTNNFFRCTSGKINLYNCYGAFTSGYGTSDSEWNTSSNIIVDNPELDSAFKLLDSSNNRLVGVYSGKYKWCNQLYLIKCTLGASDIYMNMEQNTLQVVNQENINNYNKWINDIKTICNIPEEMEYYNILKIER